MLQLVKDVALSCIIHQYSIMMENSHCLANAK